MRRRCEVGGARAAGLALAVAGVAVGVAVEAARGATLTDSIALAELQSGSARVLKTDDPNPTSDLIAFGLDFSAIDWNAFTGVGQAIAVVDIAGGPATAGDTFGILTAIDGTTLVPGLDPTLVIDEPLSENVGSSPAAVPASELLTLAGTSATSYIQADPANASFSDQATLTLDLLALYDDQALLAYLRQSGGMLYLFTADDSIVHSWQTTLVAVPEPGTAALALLLGLPAVARRATRRGASGSRPAPG